MDVEEGKRRVREVFGSREQMLGSMLIDLSRSGQPCDVTFYDRKPILDVKVPQSIFLALAYGAGPKKLKQMLDRIQFSDGTTVSFGEIWTINPMPVGGFKDEELADVDLKEAEQRLGDGGETMREMISKTYHCQSKKEEDRFIRRFIAS
jgi:hypothetical protein